MSASLESQNIGHQVPVISPRKSPRNRETSDVVPYYGRAVAIRASDELRTALNTKVLTLMADMDKASTSLLGDTKSFWKQMRSDLESIEKNLSFADDNYGIERYKLDIFAEVVVPYLEDMKSRFHIDKLRVQQLKSLLGIISYCAPVPLNSESNAPRAGVQASIHPSQEHPADVLSKIDDLAVRVQSGIWTSQLQKLLVASTEKQWRPILRDNQRMLKSVGSRLVGVGLAELLGRPMLMLYPVYMIATAGAKVVQEIDHKKKPTPETWIQIIKGLLLLWGASRLMGLMSMFQGLGMSCLLIGCAAIAIAMNDTLTKVAAPLISQHFVRIDTFMMKLSAFEQQSFGTLSGYIANGGASARGAGARGRAPSSSSSSHAESAEESATSKPSTATTEAANDEIIAPASITIDLTALAQAGQTVAAAATVLAAAAGATVSTANIHSVEDAVKLAENVLTSASRYIQNSSSDVDAAYDTAGSGAGTGVSTTITEILEIDVDEPMIGIGEYQTNAGGADIAPIDSNNDDDNNNDDNHTSDVSNMMMDTSVNDDEYDIPSIEELESMSDYHHQQTAGEGDVMRRRKGGDNGSTANN